jgi:hypothetical protein
VVVVERLRRRGVRQVLRDAHRDDRLQTHDRVLGVRAEHEAVTVEPGDIAAQPVPPDQDLHRQVVGLGTA